jgi:predicted tellurium resistance membrane protein TerC
MSRIIIESISLFLVGILAGEEFIVRYGLQPAMDKLEDRAHILARIAVVRRLKVVVPAIMLPSVIAAILVLITAADQTGTVFRWLGAVSLLAFVLFSFLGTVPINMKVNDWKVDSPPSNWKAIVKRWELLDTFRSTAAMLAFIFFLVDIAVQLSR